MPLQITYIYSALLLLGAAPLPYGYYTLLRICACGTFTYAAIIAHRNGSRVLPWALALLAVLFNPLIPVHLNKSLWICIDIGSGIFLLLISKRIARAPNQALQRTGKA